MNELICSIIHIYYGRIPLQTDFFLPLIKPFFQHQHIKSVNIRLIRAIPHKERTAKRSEKRYNKEVKKRTESPPSKLALHFVNNDIMQYFIQHTGISLNHSDKFFDSRIIIPFGIQFICQHICCK